MIDGGAVHAAFFVERHDNLLAFMNPIVIRIYVCFYHAFDGESFGDFIGNKAAYETEMFGVLRVENFNALRDVGRFFRDFGISWAMDCQQKHKRGRYSDESSSR